MWTDDLIIFGDLDEIPNPDRIKFDGNSYTFNQKKYDIPYINTESNQKWHGTYMCKYSDIENSFMNTREKNEFWDWITQDGI
jgi:hypothetical protein